jgi:fibronectin type 3 domain-containing protein
VTVSDGQLNLRFHDAGGPDLNWVINAIIIEPKVPVEPRFDFGTGSSPVESGYVRVTESTVYSAGLGYGWSSVAGLGSRDRGAPDDLRRDLVFASSVDGTFNVDLANGPYKVTVIIGDVVTGHDLVDVFAEDVLQVNHLTVSKGSFSSQEFAVTVSDGQLNLRFHDAGGPDLNWVINAIIIEPKVFTIL